jgi:hypothetical protein
MLTNPTFPSQLTNVLNAADPQRMFADTETLSASAFAGRRVGAPGHAEATFWLIDRFHEAGWETHPQPFALTTPVLDVWAPLTLTALSPEGEIVRTLTPRTEFCEHPRSGTKAQAVQGRVVPLAFDHDPTGCWIALDAVPQGEALADLATRLAEQGALGLLTPLSPRANGFLSKRVMAGEPVALPILSVRADLLPQLVGMQVQANIPVSARMPEGMNVIAQFPGDTSPLTAAPILIGAHYDGVGDDMGGFRLPGATDNAAAVAVLLELARLFPQFPDPPHRPVWLVAFDAEEVGAQGSRALAHSLKAQGLTPTVINLDGAARVNDAIWVEAGPETQDLIAFLDQAGRWLSIPLIMGNIASDHRQFGALGFPAVGLSVGAANLHTPADAIDQVQPEAQDQALSLILTTLWQLAWE